MRLSELGGEPPLSYGYARWVIASPAPDEALPSPHDPEKALHRCKGRADDRGAVSRGFRGGQHGAWWLLNTPEEENFIFS